MSRIKSRRFGGYTVHKYDWEDPWKPDDAKKDDEPPTFASLDYALIVAKRLMKGLNVPGTMGRRPTTVRRDGEIVAKIKIDGTVEILQPAKTSAVLP